MARILRVLLPGAALSAASVVPSTPSTNTVKEDVEAKRTTAVPELDNIAEPTVLDQEFLPSSSTTGVLVSQDQEEVPQEQVAAEVEPAQPLPSASKGDPSARASTTADDSASTSSSSKNEEEDREKAEVQEEEPPLVIKPDVDPSTIFPAPTSGPIYYLRWLWWVLIAYMFFAQATVCDEWFVPAIEVVCEKYGIPEDVAGATLMALGCNGPEMFTNAIALFITHSDVGVGTIVGSEIFNLLLIVGVSIIATPNVEQLGLQIDKYPFIRDCFFYMLSILLLYWVLQDEKVTFVESLTLLCFAGVFGAAVGLTDRVLIAAGIRQAKSAEDAMETGTAKTESSYTSLEGDGSTEAAFAKLAGARLDVNVTRPKAIEFGSTKHQMQVAKDGLNVQNLYFDSQEKKAAGLSMPLLNAPEGSCKIGFSQLSDIQVPTARTVCFVANAKSSGEAIKIETTLASEGDVGKFLQCLGLANGTCSGDSNLGHVHISPEEYLATSLATLKNGAVPLKEKASTAVALPINYALGRSMSWCDPKQGATKPRWLSAFCVSMGWLALFSYVMVVSADFINIQFGITQAVLGVTLCAAGTSFPNLWASYLTAKGGKSSMAVANALGSNVQNVFLALALPWTVKTFFADGQFIPMATPGIMDGVLWMGGTWALLVALAYNYKFKLYPWMGYTFFVLYFVYLYDACFLQS
ncbi:unnamed protein product [Amoebophrya sp. A25]|nr:unnamed protein product [Amoebophrya sp. A25]|eukprot:GSA25T00023866001.1